MTKLKKMQSMLKIKRKTGEKLSKKQMILSILKPCQMINLNNCTKKNNDKIISPQIKRSLKMSYLKKKIRLSWLSRLKRLKRLIYRHNSPAISQMLKINRLNSLKLWKGQHFKMINLMSPNRDSWEFKNKWI